MHVATAWPSGLRRWSKDIPIPIRKSRAQPPLIRPYGKFAYRQKYSSSPQGRGFKSHSRHFIFSTDFVCAFSCPDSRGSRASGGMYMPALGWPRLDPPPFSWRATPATTHNNKGLRFFLLLFYSFFFYRRRRRAGSCAGGTPAAPPPCSARQFFALQPEVSCPFGAAGKIVMRWAASRAALAPRAVHMRLALLLAAAPRPSIRRPSISLVTRSPARHNEVAATVVCRLLSGPAPRRRRTHR